jgi:hypothetical protein
MPYTLTLSVHNCTMHRAIDQAFFEVHPTLDAATLAFRGRQPDRLALESGAANAVMDCT